MSKLPLLSGSEASKPKSTFWKLIHVDVTRANKVVAGTGEGNVANVRRIELLEYKITGTTNNPDASGTYANEVLYLKSNFSVTGTATLRPGLIPMQQSTDSAPHQHWKFPLNIVKPQIVLQDTSATPVISSELTADYRAHPMPLAYCTDPDGASLTTMEFAIHTSPTLDTEATYTNLYLWLAVELYSNK